MPDGESLSLLGQRVAMAHVSQMGYWMEDAEQVSMREVKVHDTLRTMDRKMMLERCGAVSTANSLGCFVSECYPSLK